MLLSELFRQYLLFVAPPSLSVQTKTQGENVLVSGKTLPSAIVEVDKRLILLEKDGSFSVEPDRGNLGEKVEIRATSRSGKSTVIDRLVD